MIVLGKLEFSNWFSYGENVCIDLGSNIVTQLVGEVGAGKSSIPIILQELLYGKNIKGFKKSELKNRNTDNILTAKLEFTKGSDKYEIFLTRKSNIDLALYRNEEDISAHTATGTYKIIEDIIGIPFSLFSQLTYQSQKSQLDFLTATDTERKKFLISLFNLNKYTEYFNLSKSLVSTLELDIKEVDGSISTIKSWIERNSLVNLDEEPLVEVPSEPIEEKEMLRELDSHLFSIDSINKAIIKNEEYKRMKSKLDIEQPKEVEINSGNIESSIVKAQKEKHALEKELTKLRNFKGICPTCSQKIDIIKRDARVYNIKEELTTIQLKIKSLDIEKIDKDIVSIKWFKYRKNIKEFEDLTNFIDPTLPSVPKDKTELENEIFELNRIVEEKIKIIRLAEEYNKKSEAHNSKVAYILEETNKTNIELSSKEVQQDEIRQELNDALVLKNIFSTRGIVSYKLEYMVQELQELISNYLVELSSGRFQLHFKLNEDKLDVIITDNGKEISTAPLSSGELALINIGTLLAVRKLMSSISSTKINHLVLDENVSVLDEPSKNNLIEVLLKEQDLNIFIMNHSFSHPMVETINVTKENSISRLDNG